MASTEKISKLNLAIIEHPRPYTLRWLEKGNEVIVSKQALVTSSIVEYKDEVVCYVLPADASLVDHVSVIEMSLFMIKITPTSSN